MALDDRQKVLLKTFTRAELEAMSVEDLVTLVGEAQKLGGKYKGTAVVKNKTDKKIKYDDPKSKGQYYEEEETP